MNIIKGSLFQRADLTRMGWHVWRGNTLLGVFHTRAQARVWVRDFSAHDVDAEAARRISTCRIIETEGA